MKKRIILITGKHYSGKGYIVDLMKSFFDKNGISHQSYSAREIIGEFIRDIQNSALGTKYPFEENSQTIRAVGQLMTVTLEKESGLPLITSRNVETIRKSSNSVHIVDSIWHPHLIRIWRNLANEFDIKIIAIDALDEDRYKGFLDKNSSSEPVEKTVEFFHSRDVQEDQPNIEFAPHVSKCMKMSDVCIVNTRDKDMINEVEVVLNCHIL